MTGQEMRSQVPASLALLVVLALPAAAQDLLPPGFSRWNTSAVSKVRPEALEQIAGNDAAILREYGSLAAERRAYTREADTLTVTLYRMRDASSAFGAYSFLRTEEMAAAALAKHSSISRHRALALLGELLLEVSGSDLGSLSADLKALVAQLPSPAEATQYPTLGQYVPQKGLVANSDRYLLGPLALNRLLPLGNGDWIGFADGAEVYLARYRVNGQDLSLLLAAYPTPQAAARKLEELGRWFDLNSRDEKAGSRPVLFARRVSSLVALVAESHSRALADSLLGQVQYETQVTWNEPGRSALEPGLGEILVGVFVGTGLILLFALVAGIAFGGVRLVVKHFLPGKVFDRPSTVEILQLGLTTKPIEAKDFY